jgi:hypothetical protein
MLRLYVECVQRDAGSSHESAQPKAAAVHERSGFTGKSACATVSKRDAGLINSKELRVNKRDSPRISEDIHIDRKQPLGVSLKGSSLALLSAEQGESPNRARVRRDEGKFDKFFGATRVRKSSYPQPI